MSAGPGGSYLPGAAAGAGVAAAEALLAVGPATPSALHRFSPIRYAS